MANRPVITLHNVDKRFPGVHALKGVDFSLNPGEIHALVGENGAGKSTLMKILTGVYQKDMGEMYYRGHLFNPHNPKHALEAGIGIVHQELNMMDHLTVAENIFIGREVMKVKGLILDKKAQNNRAAELFKHLIMNIDPTETLGSLTVGKQQMVEIAKAVSHDLKVLILDEPTAALTETEIDELFEIMRDLKSKNVAMIHISHRLDEIHRITDRVSVMRDGEMIDTDNTKDISKQDIINKMVGRVIYEKHKTESNVSENAHVVLRVRNLNAGKMVKNVSFELHRGEILGFAGLIGAGRTETARAVFGADPVQGGTVEINGKVVNLKSPQDAVANGIGYLSEDRKRYGLAINLNVKDNMALATYEKYQKGPFVTHETIDSDAKSYVKKLNLKTPSVRQLVRNLSGGNQQKVVLAKWLIRNSDILIFDEPTRGIDVGAKSEIYHLMNELVAQGKSIIMISSELPEILRMSDRIIVMCEGRIAGTLNINEASQERILEFATNREKT